MADKKDSIDALDRKLVAALVEDGQMPVAAVAERMGVTAPTVRSRLRGLLGRGVLRIAGLIDPSATAGLTVALVGITVQSHMQLDEKLEEISRLERVHWAAVVTGRYDILVEIVISDDIADLYAFLNEDLSQIGGISSSESFVVMKSRRKWVLLPERIRSGYE